MKSATVNGYERVEKETWKAICNQDADKLITMCPDELLDNVSKEFKTSKKTLKENLKSLLYDSNNNDSYIDYCLKIDNKWYSVLAMECIYESGL